MGLRDYFVEVAGVMGARLVRVLPGLRGCGGAAPERALAFGDAEYPMFPDPDVLRRFFPAVEEDDEYYDDDDEGEYVALRRAA